MKISASDSQVKFQNETSLIILTMSDAYVVINWTGEGQREWPGAAERPRDGNTAVLLPFSISN